MGRRVYSLLPNSSEGGTNGDGGWRERGSKTEREGADGVIWVKGIG